jgi:hypothetical protein
MEGDRSLELEESVLLCRARVANLQLLFPGEHCCLSNALLGMLAFLDQV